MDNNIKKCLKSYLIGNKNLNNNNTNKAYKYFNKSLQYINNIKKNNINKNEYEDILLETETECIKNIIDISNNFLLYYGNIIDTKSNSSEYNKSNNKSNLEIYNNITNDSYLDFVNNDINLFDIINKGDIVNLFNNINNNYNFFIFDEDGNTPGHITIIFGDTLLLKKFLLLGLPINIVNKHGHTLLETAALLKDNNMINFLLKNGANMEKHLFFRDNKNTIISKYNYIDYSIVLNIIFSNIKSEYIINLNFLFGYFNKTDIVGFGNMTYYDLIASLETLLNNINVEYKNTYINILREELDYKLNNLFYCPINLLEILLTYLIPFIDYKFIISIDWYIKYELKYIILDILKKNLNIKNKLNIKKILNKKYTNLYFKDYINNIISHWVSKI
jgi:ankyrin repeat protein